MQNLIPLIDGDLVVYRAGFVSKEGDTLEQSLQIVKTTMVSIVDAFPQAPSRELYLTLGVCNYRDAIAETVGYKENRKGAPKPPFYEEIRRYLVDVWGGVMIDGREADDAIGCRQWKLGKSSCIVSYDKDMKMIPGYHYDWRTKEFCYVSMKEANLNFFKQVLIGDRTDNIIGLYKVGPVTAAKLLEPAESWVDCLNICQKEYAREFGDDGENRLRENMQLLWIQREEDKICEPMEFKKAGDSNVGTL